MGNMWGTKENEKRLKAHRWVLLCENGYAALDGIAPELKNALVFDGRDNEETKVRFYSILLKTPFVVEVLPK